MELNEEEKEAIETLKEVASDEFSTIGDDISPKMAQNILNLIDKQQKEIEELKEQNNQLSNYLNDSYYISADEIRAIITEYQKQLQSADTERTAIMLSNFIMVLNDLLEEQ